MKYTSPVSPFLFGLFFLLVCLNNFKGNVNWIDFFLVLLVTEICIGIIYAFLSKLSNKSKASWNLTLLLFLIFFYASLNELVYSFLGLLNNSALFFPIILLAIILLIYFFNKKISNHYPRLNQYLNTTFTVLIVIELFSFFSWRELETNDAALNKLQPNRSEYNQIKSCKECPNIFFLLFDGYANEKSLKKFWKFDNSTFINELKRRNFYYCPDSKSNYGFTDYSMASLLNLKLFPYPTKETTVLKLIKNNIFTEHILKDAYNFFNLSTFDIGDQKNEDSYELMFDKDDFAYFVYAKTAIFKLHRFFKYHILGHQIELSKLDKLKKYITLNKPNNKPNLILYHSMISHFPYHFNEDGSLNHWMWLHGVRSRSNDYLTQIKYSNRIIIDIVDNILKNSPNSLIVIMSDHGYRLLIDGTPEEKEAERTQNFCSIYFPDKNYTFQNQSIDSISFLNVGHLILKKVKDISSSKHF